MRRFVSLWDAHVGRERVGGRLRPLHDLHTISIANQFISDFKPHEVICGGDMMDCGAISHHNERKHGLTEGMRLEEDAADTRALILDPIESIRCDRVYLIGNHEAWLDQFTEMHPSLGKLLAPETLLGLSRWKVIPQGGNYRLGKLAFKHGDKITGGEHVAKAAVINSERSIRFGHRHTWAVYTKMSDLDVQHKHTGVSMPCMCRKGPGYGKGAANKWINGFGYGYVDKNGSFYDYVAIVHGGKAVINGKVYKG